MGVGRVVVVGAGVAGLAAAGRLRDAGIDTVLVEAGSRAGGRARTTSVRGHVFDHGASWLHDAKRNPLAAMATPQDSLIESDSARSEHISIAGRPITEAERADYAEAWNLLDQMTAPLVHGPDMTLAEAMTGMRRNSWCHLIALWEGAVIAAVDTDRLGLHDWYRNRLGGHNLVPPEGVGAYVLRKLATAVTLDAPAQTIRWGGTGVRVETGKGTIAADAVIVTVSTGVLAAGSLRFDPALPTDLQHAIHALPMGLLSKVVLPATGSDRLGLQTDTRVADQDGLMTFAAWPQGRRHLVGYFGGQQAWDAAQRPGAGTELARTELRRVFGAGALASVGPDALETTWGTDALFQGAYAYAGRGDADQRGVLGAGFPGERVLFAGEATRMDGLAGTVGGAHLSGIEAAGRLVSLNAAPAAAPAGNP